MSIGPVLVNGGIKESVLKSGSSIMTYWKIFAIALLQ